MKAKLFLLCILISTSIFTQNSAPIDVLHYRFALALSDSTDIIVGKASISFKAIQPTERISFDLVKKENETGMTVSKITDNGNTLNFTQNTSKIDIVLAKPLQVGEEKTIDIDYLGIPADGLIISKNNHQHRTFFADNWPNRAHNWLPCIDEPRDKATVEFLITAPQHYQVVGSGIQVEESNLENNLKLTHWREDVPLPTKVMAIGVADFAVQTVGEVNCTPVYSWVFPEDRDKGFQRYGQAKDILSFFMDYVGVYGYKKLANVQSKTTFGGLENAGTIFYYENSATDDKPMETLLAHEIAHQWFGDMVTEKQFAHLWLSEGFATYLTHIYMESKYGRDTLVKRLADDRTAVIAFSKTNDKAVIDSISPYMDLLNLNNYEKGGWVLHMLRETIGDNKFHQLLRTFYDHFKGKNADSQDFQKEAETISGQNLDSFFRQWLYNAGQPNLKVSWSNKGKKVQIAVTQLQQTPFVFPLEIAFKYASGKSTVQTFNINKTTEVFTFTADEMPIEVVLDPNTALLFEGVIVKE
jgi:aminopeptidase N